MRDRKDHRGAALTGASLVMAAFLAATTATAQSCGGFRVLVFSKTKGFRHDAQIKTGTTLIKTLGVANGFAVDATEDASKFTTANLRQYAAVVFLNTTGDVLDSAQQTAFEGFLTRGGGLVGVRMSVLGGDAAVLYFHRSHVCLLSFGRGTW